MVLRALMVVFVFATFLASAAPGANAQVVPSFYSEVFFAPSTPLPAPLAPGETGTTNVTVVVRCHLTMQPGPVMEGLVQPRFQIEHYARADQAWVQVSVQPTTQDVEFSAQECLDGGQHQYPVEASASVLQGAPAFHKSAVTLKAHTSSGTHGVVQFMATAGFAGHFTAQAVDANVDVAPDTPAELELTLVNDANGPIQVQVARFEASDPSVMVAVPGPQLVGSLIAGAETNRLTVPFDIQSDAAAGHGGMLTLVVSAHSADDTTQKLGTQQVSYFVRVVDSVPSDGTQDPLPEELPAPNMVLPGLVVFGLAAFLRRRII